MKKKPWLIPFVITILLIGVVAGIVITANVYHSHTVVFDGPSMEPTIHNGTTLTLTKYGSPAQVKRGDIVEYKSTKGIVKSHTASAKLVHRVIALPGERIVIKNNVVTVYNQQNPNGINPDTFLSQEVVTAGDVDITLAANEFFVMGDNRPDALDSRVIGPINYSDIIAKANL